jgi:class 3 adenylate cyclase
VAPSFARDHLFYAGDDDAVLDEIEEFLTGARHGPESHRVLTTVLFTDIVGSTELAVRLGDRGWRDLLERHHATVRNQLVRLDGVEVDTAGDGFFATFDGPGRAVRCALATVDALADMDVTIRAGLHTGECEIVGGRSPAWRSTSVPVCRRSRGRAKWSCRAR